VESRSRATDRGSLAKPMKLKHFLVFGHPMEVANLPYLHFASSLYTEGSSTLCEPGTWKMLDTMAVQPWIRSICVGTNLIHDFMVVTFVCKKHILL